MNDQKQRIASRVFNEVKVDPVLARVTKTSRLSFLKLLDESNWYKALPHELRRHTPYIYNYVRPEGGGLEMEHLPFPTLAELCIQDRYALASWFAVMTQVFRLHRAMLAEARQPWSMEDCREMYIDKTRQRLTIFRESAEGWLGELVDLETISYNGQFIPGLPAVLRELEAKAAPLCAPNGGFHIVHGDLVFSNLLYDERRDWLYMIDPRGSFGHAGLFGDPRYDMAKLRQSAVGMYDWIKADRFTLQRTPSGFRGAIEAGGGVAPILAERFDAFVMGAGYDVAEIKRIQALLFLSLLPLHSDAPRQQEMMFLEGLRQWGELK